MKSVKTAFSGAALGGFRRDIEGFLGILKGVSRPVRSRAKVDASCEGILFGAENANEAVRYSQVQAHSLRPSNPEKYVELSCDQTLADGYKSQSQIARVLSEAWFAKNAYCLACDADEVRQTKANTGATDFVCPKCAHRYELKAFPKRPRRKLVDGAWDTMMTKIHQKEAPTLCLMERTPEWRVNGLTAIHSSFLVPDVIEARPALGSNARRAGWVGCNIRLDRIGRDGEVDVVTDGRASPASEVRRRFQRFLPLTKKSVEQRGWTLLTLGMVRSLARDEFSLADVYKFESQFAKAYPQNKHVKDKIRQQLQILRDLGVLEFIGRGEYRIIN